VGYLGNHGQWIKKQTGGRYHYQSNFESGSIKVKLRDFLESVDLDFQFAELLNIETATLGISGARFTPKCVSCSEFEDIFFECKDCGITKVTFAQVRSGSGDGIYPVFQSMRGLGAAVLFDEGSSYAATQLGWAYGGPSHEVALESNVQDMLDHEIFYLGSIQVPTESNVLVDTHNLVAFADALASETDIVVVGDAGFGDVGLFAVLGPRSPERDSYLVPRLLIAVGEQGLPAGFITGTALIDKLPSSTGKEWFAFPVAASIGGGNAEFGLFQTVKHCQAVAQMCQDNEAVENMARWVARGLACIAKLKELNTELAQELLQSIDQDFSDGTFETWWVGEVNYLLNKQGKSPQILDVQRLQEHWFKSVGTQTELSINRKITVNVVDASTSVRPNFCSSCGAQAPESGAFCANCGTKIT
jgi:hypothetical protein